jgi:CRISPR-associated protein Cas1
MGIQASRQKAAFAECLFRRTVDSRNLKCAIDYLATESGTAPGPNGLKFEDLDQSERWQLARVIGQALAKGEYRPGPELKVEIPKTSGHGTRTLRIQNIEDRVVQRSIVQVIQPFLEPTFARTSFGYRPGLGREHALALASHYAETGDRWVWVLDDIRDAFNHLPHNRLLQILKQRLPNTNLVALVSTAIANRENRGLRQGGSLSPLLLNVYLDQVLDRPWAKSRPDIPLIRYADDLLALTRDPDQAADAHTHLRSLLTPRACP